ncbi:MAG TPA: di-heme oxidoredictase family protein, partial [Gemmataceae bacterium]|nr:di-heme oxidoredictase family protein [Gemmataceae bacterium]
MHPMMQLRFGVCGIIVLAATWLSMNAHAHSGPEKQLDPLAAGKELFTREWLASDKRSHAGDGLGPVFNARSCAACHYQGGVGGAGPKESNATLVTVFVPIEAGARDNPKESIKLLDRAKL